MIIHMCDKFIYRQFLIIRVKYEQLIRFLLSIFHFIKVVNVIEI